MVIPWIDMLTGEINEFTIDFTIVNDDIVEWIEILAENDHFYPIDKRIYAHRRAEEGGITYRAPTTIELQQGKEIIQSKGTDWMTPTGQAIANEITSQQRMATNPI